MYNALIGLFLFIVSFAGKDKVKKFSFTGFAQGTTYTVTYYAFDSVVTNRNIDLLLARIDSSLSIYKPYSLISQFNAAKNGLEIDTFFRFVVRKSIDVCNVTGGAFDITVYPLVDAWGFGLSKRLSLPDSATIKSLMPCIGSNKITLFNAFLKKKKPCVRIDVNGIAQGYSVDLLAKLLEEHGIHNYLVELGGEIKIKGRKQPSGDVMTIGIEGPENNEFDPVPLQKLLSVKEGALTTSGNYRKYYESNSKRISHLIDPKSGYPAQNELISVTVFAKDACTADAYDNAFMIMGLQKSLAFLKQQKEVEAYFIYKKEDGSISDTATNGFASLIIKEKSKQATLF
jgi:thiamine biosynthesis lipoprotein